MSGVASCPASVVLTSNGDLVRTATDRAGNSTTITVPVVGADQDPPAITASVSPPANAAGWHNTAGPVTVTYTCSDDGGSGVASCPPPATVNVEGVTTVTGTATDNAGNSASVDTIVRIDRTAPSVGVSSALILVAAPVRGTAADSLSGIERVRVTFTPIVGVAPDRRRHVGVLGRPPVLHVVGSAPGPARDLPRHRGGHRPRRQPVTTPGTARGEPPLATHQVP